MRAEHSGSYIKAGSATAKDSTAPYGQGAIAYNNAVVEIVGDVVATASSNTNGVDAGNGGRITVGGNATGGKAGAHVSNGGEVVVQGNVAGAIGVWHYEGGNVTVNGYVEGSQTYIQFTRANPAGANLLVQQFTHGNGYAGTGADSGYTVFTHADYPGAMARVKGVAPPPPTTPAGPETPASSSTPSSSSRRWVASSSSASSSSSSGSSSSSASSSSVVASSASSSQLVPSSTSDANTVVSIPSSSAQEESGFGGPVLWIALCAVAALAIIAIIILIVLKRKRDAGDE